MRLSWGRGAAGCGQVLPLSHGFRDDYCSPPHRGTARSSYDATGLRARHVNLRFLAPVPQLPSVKLLGTRFSKPWEGHHATSLRRQLDPYNLARSLSNTPSTIPSIHHRSVLPPDFPIHPRASAISTMPPSGASYNYEPFCTSYNPQKGVTATWGIPSHPTCLSHTRLTSLSSHTLALQEALTSLQAYSGWTAAQSRSLASEVEELVRMRYENGEAVEMLDSVNQAVMGMTDSGEDTGEVMRLWKDVKGAYPTLEKVWCNEVKR